MSFMIAKERPPSGPLPLVGELKSSPVMTRHPANPVLSAKDVPYKTALVYNAGITKYQGKYVMVFRNDYGSIEEQRLDGTNLGLAFSDDGIKWKVEPRPCFELHDREIRRAYDPRLTVLDGRCYMCFAVDTHHGVLGGIAVTEDFQAFEILHMTTPDNRNMVLFPEKIGGLYYRLDRPFQPGGQGHIWMCDSPDLVHWGNPRCIMESRRFAWDQGKIGPGAPPIKTDEGWLVIYHGTTPRCNGLIYKAGVALLDLDDPSKVIARGKEYLMAPSTDYERMGDVPNVVFVTSAIPDFEKDEMRLYYGGADTCFCMATAKISDLIQFAKTG